MPTWLGWLLALALKFWNGMKPPVIVTESEKAGQLQQALDTETKENVVIKEAVDARNDVVVLSNGELQQHTPVNDPDFRD